MDKLNFKISATDDSKKAFDSSKKSLQEYKKEITSLLKQTAKTGDPFKGMGKNLKTYSKEFKNINKHQNKFNNSMKKMSNAGDDLADTLKNVNREDVAVAGKMGQTGKGMQTAIKSQAEARKSQAEQVLKKSSGQDSSSRKIQVMKVDKLEVKGSGKGIVSSKSGQEIGKTVSEGLGKKMDKTFGDGLGKIGAGIGMFAGGLIAAVGVFYSMASARAGAFMGSANQQMGGLQQLGFGSSGVKGQEEAGGGFFRGHKGEGPGGNAYYLTGQQQVSAMSSFGRQTGGSKKSILNMMYGKQGGNNIGALNQAYGLDIGQTAGTAGMFERFGQGKSGMGLLNKSMRTAEGVGMGGARMKEFLDGMEEAVSQAVYDGSTRSHSSLLGGLETIMGSSDERLKAMAPQIMRSSTQAMNQAAMLQGGASGNFMYQAVMNQRKAAGQSTGVFDIREQLSGDWLPNMKAAAALARNYSSDKAWSADYFNQGTGLNIPSNKLSQELMALVEKGTIGGNTLTEGAFNNVISGRMKDTGEMIESTARADYVDSINTLSGANAKATETVIELRSAMQDFINGVYNKGSGAMNKMFGTDLGPTEPVEAKFE